MVSECFNGCHIINFQKSLQKCPPIILVQYIFYNLHFLILKPLYQIKHKHLLIDLASLVNLILKDEADTRPQNLPTPSAVIHTIHLFLKHLTHLASLVNLVFKDEADTRPQHLQTPGAVIHTIHLLLKRRRLRPTRHILRLGCPDLVGLGVDAL